MFSKKGVSPLIATVLLLAFAVALATVIIQLEPFGKCTMDDVKFDKDGSGQPIVCYDQSSGEINAFIFNNDEVEITGFRVTISGTKDSVNIASLEQHIGKNEVKKVSIPYNVVANGQVKSLKLFPQIDRGGRFDECNMKEEVTSIPLCQQ